MLGLGNRREHLYSYGKAFETYSKGIIKYGIAEEKPFKTVLEWATGKEKNKIKLLKAVLTAAYHVTPDSLKNRFGKLDTTDTPFSQFDLSSLKPLGQGHNEAVYEYEQPSTRKHYAIAVNKTEYDSQEQAVSAAQNARKDYLKVKKTFNEMPTLVPEEQQIIVFTKIALDENNKGLVYGDGLDIIGDNNLMMAGPPGKEQLVLIDPHTFEGQQTQRVQTRIKENLEHLAKLSYKFMTEDSSTNNQQSQDEFYGPTLRHAHP